MCVCVAILFTLGERNKKQVCTLLYFFPLSFDFPRSSYFHHHKPHTTHHLCHFSKAFFSTKHRKTWLAPLPSSFAVRGSNPSFRFPPTFPQTFKKLIENSETVHWLSTNPGCFPGIGSSSSVLLMRSSGSDFFFFFYAKQCDNKKSLCGWKPLGVL